MIRRNAEAPIDENPILIKAPRTIRPDLKFPPPKRRLFGALSILTLVLAACALIALWAGYSQINLAALRHDEMARRVFFRLRLPRVVLAGIIGATLAAVGAALQALFRNPLADPFTLGVSGGGALGASVAIALGWGERVSGVPLVFVTAFCGALTALLLVHRISRAGPLLLPGALLLGGVVVNLI